MSTLSDESLIAGLAAGDTRAATEFVRRFQGRVFGLALAILGDAGAAEDAAQEAFVRAWRHAGAYDARRGSVATWLLTITRNLSIDTLRLRSSQPLDPALLEAKLEMAGPGSASVIDELPETDRVRSALAELPPDQRRALVLAVYFGRTALEISESDATPVGTVKSRIRAGLMRLRSELGVPNEL